MEEKTILIVDDEAPIREMIRMSLDMAGFNCREAADTREAYRVIADSRPDLVLLDWMLPGGSGIELLRRLRKEELTADLPVIMLTAKTDEDNKIQGLDVGADDYITKPFAPREMLSRIKALLRRTSTGTGGSVIEVQGLKLDISSHRVYIDTRPVDTKSERIAGDSCSIMFGEVMCTLKRERWTCTYDAYGKHLSLKAVVIMNVCKPCGARAIGSPRSLSLQHK